MGGAAERLRESAAPEAKVRGLPAPQLPASPRSATFSFMHEWQVWLVASLLLFVAEMLAPGFWLLSVAVGCLTAGAVSLVIPGAVVPALSFAAGTFLSLVGIRPFLLRHLHPRGT